MVENRYKINQWLIGKQGRKVMVNYYEVHLYDGKEYIIYECSDEYGYHIKGHEIDFMLY